MRRTARIRRRARRPLRALGPRRALALRLALAAGLAACRGDDLPPLTEVPVFPGARLREAESAFQRQVLDVVLEPGQPLPAVEVYETTAAFASVAGFYERWFAEGSFATGRFSAASRIRQLAEGARGGLPQQLAAGRLLFGRGGAGADTMPAAAVADSLAGLAARLEGVEGLIAVGRIPLGTQPPTSAVVSIERPHLDASRLTIDSLTVLTILTTRETGPAPPRTP